jgi:Fe-S cluster assembly iron-binding protein IscA
MSKISSLEKSGNTIKTLKNSFINDKNFFSSGLKGDDKKQKENNFQNNNNKIDIKISINNYGKHSIDKKIDNSSLKDNSMYKPKSNISIFKKNESLESDSILQSSNLNYSINNIDKSKFKLKNPSANSLKYSQAMIQPTKIPGNNCFAFNPKLKNNYISSSNPPLKTEVNGNYQYDS